MNFDPEQWNCHKKGQDARSLILENLPADVETLCKTVGRSQSQVKRHIQTLRAEGKVKRQGALIVAACTAFILLLPAIGHCVETDCLENNENIFLHSPL